MKKEYVSPSVCVYAIIGQSLMQTSMKLGDSSDSSETVNDQNDIGFVREESFQDDDSWD